MSVISSGIVISVFLADLPAYIDQGWTLAWLKVTGITTGLVVWELPTN